VRALYDFEPTEAGELGFQKDDIIEVLATSYQDWWKGELYGRQGIFPVNYVEEIKEGESNQNTGDLDDEAHVLHEAKNVDGLIQMLQNIDPRRDNFSDNETLQDTYNNVLGVRPKLVELIRKHGEKKGRDDAPERKARSCQSHLRKDDGAVDRKIQQPCLHCLPATPSLSNDARHSQLFHGTAWTAWTEWPALFNRTVPAAI